MAQAGALQSSSVHAGVATGTGASAMTEHGSKWLAGSKNAPRSRAQRSINLATYDSTHEAERAGTAASKAKESAPLPEQAACAAGLPHTDPAGELEQYGA